MDVIDQATDGLILQGVKRSCHVRDVDASSRSVIRNVTSLYQGSVHKQCPISD